MKGRPPCRPTFISRLQQKIGRHGGRPSLAAKSARWNLRTQISHVWSRLKILDEDLHLSVSVHPNLGNIDFRSLMRREQYIVVRGVCSVHKFLGCEMSPKMVASTGCDMNRSKDFLILNVA